MRLTIRAIMLAMALPILARAQAPAAPPAADAPTTAPPAGIGYWLFVCEATDVHSAQMLYGDLPTLVDSRAGGE